VVEHAIAHVLCCRDEESLQISLHVFITQSDALVQWCDYDGKVWERPLSALKDSAPVKARSIAGGMNVDNFERLISKLFHTSMPSGLGRALMHSTGSTPVKSSSHRRIRYRVKEAFD
jgi:hypothetical protein